MWFLGSVVNFVMSVPHHGRGTKRGISTLRPVDRIATEELRQYISKVEGHKFSMETVRGYIERGADPNLECQNIDLKLFNHGQTLLMVLSKLGEELTSGRLHHEILGTFEYLLGLPGIDVSVGDVQGNRLIHYVTYMHDPNFLEMLVRNVHVATNIDIVDIQGLSALHIACRRDTVPIEMFITLLRAGANPFLQTRSDKRTPLHLAMIGNWANPNLPRVLYILRKIIEFGVDLGDDKYKDSHGDTFLHYAVMYVKSKSFCMTILENGGYKSLNVHDAMGLDPLSATLPCNCNNPGARAAIKEYNARMSAAARISHY